MHSPGYVNIFGELGLLVDYQPRPHGLLLLVGGATEKKPLEPLMNVPGAPINARPQNFEAPEVAVHWSTSMSIKRAAA